MVYKIVTIINWILSLSLLYLMISVLTLFFSSYTNDPNVHEANDVAGTETYIAIMKFFVFMCFTVLPFWLITGIADLVDFQSDFFKLKFIGIFILSFVLTGIVLGIVSDHYGVNVITCCFG